MKTDYCTCNCKISSCEFVLIDWRILQMNKTLKSLTTAFMMAAVAVGAVGGLAVQPADAANMHDTAAQASVISQAQMQKMYDWQITDNYIAKPTQELLAESVDRGIMTQPQSDFAAACAAEVNPDGVRANDLTNDMRRDFSDCMTNTQNRYVAAAENLDQAYDLGIKGGLAPYFAQCQADAGITPGDLDGTAQELADNATLCMEQAHWENDIKPEIISSALSAAAGGATFLAATTLLRRRSRY
jgi:hypothetical protein